jgi:hypothetical protein
MNAQNAFSVVAVFYSVANLGSMGLEINLRETITSLRSVRVLALTLGCRCTLRKIVGSRRRRYGVRTLGSVAEPSYTRSQTWVSQTT